MIAVVLNVNHTLVSVLPLVQVHYHLEDLHAFVINVSNYFCKK
jgi:hypothetical protein